MSTNSKTIARSFFPLFAAVLLLSAGACDTNPYCVGGTCGEPTGDGTGSDGDADSTEGTTEGGDDARPEGGDDVGDAEAEVEAEADGEAGDCDGIDLMTDPANCGECGHRCNLPNAFNACVGGVCVVDRCAYNYWDVAADDPAHPETLGCEYYCIPRVTPGDCDASCVPTVAGGECDTVCNGLDDDCNG